MPAPSTSDPLGQFVNLLALLGQLVQKVQDDCPSSGYEALLRKQGCSPLASRGLPYLIRRRAERITNEQRETPAVRGALVSLAKSPKKKMTIQGEAKFLCTVYERSTLIECLCEMAEIDSLDFVASLTKGQRGRFYSDAQMPCTPFREAGNRT